MTDDRPINYEFGVKPSTYAKYETPVGESGFASYTGNPEELWAASLFCTAATILYHLLKDDQNKAWFSFKRINAPESYEKLKPHGLKPSLLGKKTIRQGERLKFWYKPDGKHYYVITNRGWWWIKVAMSTNKKTLQEAEALRKIRHKEYMDYLKENNLPDLLKFLQDEL